MEHLFAASEPAGAGIGSARARIGASVGGFAIILVAATAAMPSRLATPLRAASFEGLLPAPRPSSGSHLHFEVTKNGRAVNSLSVKMGSGLAHMESAKLGRFKTSCERCC